LTWYIIFADEPKIQVVYARWNGWPGPAVDFEKVRQAGCLKGRYVASMWITEQRAGKISIVAQYGRPPTYNHEPGPQQ
jgi:hypothetical protein